VAEWIKKQYPSILMLTRDSVLRTQTESEGMERIFQANGNQKKAGITLLIPDKKDFKTDCNRQKKVIIQ